MKLLSHLKYNRYFFSVASYIRQLLVSIYGNNKGHEIMKIFFISFQFFLLPVIAPWYLLYGYIMFKKQHLSDKKQTFRYQLTLVGIVKNEAIYLKEWIEYYRLIGVDQFIIYDNGSDDDTAKVLLNIKNRGGWI